MKKIIKYTYINLVIFLLPMFLNAATPGPGTGDPVPGIPNPIKSDTIEELLAAVLDIIVRIGTPIIVLAFIYSGFKFVEARGNPAKLEIAKKALTYTAIGAAVLLGASALGTLIGSTVKLL